MNNTIKQWINPLYKIYAYRFKWRKVCIIPFSAYVTPRSSFEGMSQIHDKALFSGHLGYGSYVGPCSNLSADIGKFSSIASNVTTIIGRHPLSEPFATTSPAFFSLNSKKFQNGSTFASLQMFKENSYVDEERGIAVQIGSDCWIGEGAAIVNGVIVGDGAVVLARAVVTKDVPPYAIVGGIPAKVIKYRYDQDTIDFLLKIKWWNQSPEWLSENWKLLCDIDKLKDYYK